MAAEHSLGPVIKLLSAGQDVPPVRTSVEQALGDTPGFVSDLAVQQGKAELEAEGAERDSRFWSGVSATGEGLVSGLLMSLGGSGLVGAGVLRLYGAYRTAQKAVKDAVETGDALAGAKTDDEIKKVKEESAKKQERNGTKKAIDKALGKA